VAGHLFVVLFGSFPIITIFSFLVNIASFVGAFWNNRRVLRIGFRVSPVLSFPFSGANIISAAILIPLKGKDRQI
jgi:hypothetical protein